jgi:hypothetical protein
LDAENSGILTIGVLNLEFRPLRTSQTVPGFIDIHGNNRDTNMPCRVLREAGDWQSQ